ncbi:MAG: RNA 3'-terminal phosphate cyclase [Promethearchaeota archaeon]
MIGELLEIDGSFGEGGGSILRLSAAYSILYNIPIKIFNIRANRPKPGLRLQHLLGLRALSELTGSKLSSCDVGTTELTFIPGNKLKNNITLKVKTAANIGLLLQPIQIACLKFKGADEIRIRIDGGGTFGEWAPGLNYLKYITYEIFKKIGFFINLNIIKHGWYPKGGAKVECILKPPIKDLKPINLTELGEISQIKGEILITNQIKGAHNISSRIKNSVISTIKKSFNINVNIKYNLVNSLSSGVSLLLWAKSDTGAIISSGTFLGRLKLSSESLGRMAANEILKYIKNDIPVDNYLSDQLIPIMAYTKEPSQIKVLDLTSHTKTNLELLKKFINREYLIKKEKNYFIIEYK